MPTDIKFSPKSIPITSPNGKNISTPIPPSKASFSDSMVFHLPRLHFIDEGSARIILDSDGPNWISTDRRGEDIIRWMEQGQSFKEIQVEYSKIYGLSLPEAWIQVGNFIGDLKRVQMVSHQSWNTPPYQGRAQALKLTTLNELWLHTNNKCNLSCSHCLVNSNPQADEGLSTSEWFKIIEQGVDLGVDRFYMTGGEPFLRPDIFELIEKITVHHDKELIILTNATLFIAGEKLEKLGNCSRSKLKLQMSLDGANSDINDPIRGKGVFERASAGFKNVSGLGFDTAVTAVVTKTNLENLKNLPPLAKKLGARSMHLMWLHKRGRIMENGGENSFFPNTDELIHLVKSVKAQCQDLGIQFDNYEAVKSRVNGQRHVKFDLGNACWDSLCVYCDGKVYPSAATSNHVPLALGDALKTPLKEIWTQSPVAHAFRNASVIHKKIIENDPFRFLTGGGDIEHTYFFSSGPHSASLDEKLAGPDPYYDLQTFFVREALNEISHAKMELFNVASGYKGPLVYHAMGEGALVCGSKGMEVSLNQPVTTLHSNCVLSFDVDKPRRIVREFYGKAAEVPQEELCCPTPYNKINTDHIPQEVLDRFYGCGSPLELADLKPGEVMVDLGSGAGIDCFIAAKMVGRQGKIIGVDMTDQMLEVARRNKPLVAANLGFDVVDFRKGFLESIPVEDQSVDLVTSNCVINLSPDKKAVFSEMWRVLKDHGRIVISDIVTGEDVPPHLRVNEQLWGECLSGALSEKEFLGFLEQAGFYGLTLLKKFFWKDIEGHKFYSMTVAGYRHNQNRNGKQVLKTAIYKGPLKAVLDEEGRIFERNVPVQVPEEVAEKLKRPPYTHSFSLTEDKIEPTPDSESCCQEPTSCC